MQTGMGCSGLQKVAQMTSHTGMRQFFEAVTTNAWKVMHLQGYGLEVGFDALLCAVVIPIAQ
ncbi:MAG: hypothetical protein ABIV07_04400 [Polaromonas sp.]